MTGASGFGRILAIALVIGTASNALAAEEGNWSVSKSSGEVWITTAGAQQASLKPEEVLKPGDTIRTGRNGRVLLVRGEETMMVSPNSVIGLPAEKKEGLSTTIVQQAGSILLEVEKRNVKHFEVETPYLAAVVKGTRFSVTVNATSTSVDVIRGQVEVADFKSGQIAQVMPGQHATAFAHGKAGLSLSGSGTFSPIEQGKPRPSSIDRIPVPKSGLSSPRNAANGHGDHAAARIKSANASLQPQRNSSSPRPGVTRISASLGEVRLNFHQVTHGLARDSLSTAGSARNVAAKDTVWSSSQANATTGGGTGSSQGNSGNASSGGNATAGTSAGAALGAAGAIAAAASAGNSNGNGNSANANGNGNGANGNGHGHGNGNGNGNNGNGHGNGH